MRKSVLAVLLVCSLCVFAQCGDDGLLGGSISFKVGSKTYEWTETPSLVQAGGTVTIVAMKAGGNAATDSIKFVATGVSGSITSSTSFVLTCDIEGTNYVNNDIKLTGISKSAGRFKASFSGTVAGTDLSTKEITGGKIDVPDSSSIL